MSPRRSFQMKMTIAFAGPIPPAIGAARAEFLERRSRVASGRASRAYLEALREVEAAIGPVTLPSPALSGDDPETQIRRWEPLRVRLAASANHRDDLPGERLARFALARAVEANHDSSESPQAARMHNRMHNLGRFVSGLYCCFGEWDVEQGLWFDRCAIALSHSGLGVSPGFHCRPAVLHLQRGRRRLRARSRYSLRGDSGPLYRRSLLDLRSKRVHTRSGLDISCLSARRLSEPGISGGFADAPTEGTTCPSNGRRGRSATTSTPSIVKPAAVPSVSRRVPGLPISTSWFDEVAGDSYDGAEAQAPRSA